VIPDIDNLQFVPFRGDDALVSVIGRVDVASTADGVVLRVDCAKAAANSVGGLHGGALSTLFDVALHAAAREGLQGEALTISLDVKFMRSGELSSPLHIFAQVLRAGRTLATCSASTFQNGRVIAHATGQFMKLQ
jgi:uncharacterized protein (TIGR00369 family)